MTSRKQQSSPKRASRCRRARRVQRDSTLGGLSHSRLPLPIHVTYLLLNAMEPTSTQGLLIHSFASFSSAEGNSQGLRPIPGNSPATLQEKPLHGCSVPNEGAGE